MPDFGIVEGLSALGLGGLFGGEAAAAGVGAELGGLAGAGTAGALTGGATAGAAEGAALGAETALAGGSAGLGELGGAAAGIGGATPFAGAAGAGTQTAFGGLADLSGAGSALGAAGDAGAGGGAFGSVGSVGGVSGGAGSAASGGGSIFDSLLGSAKANPMQAAGLGLGAGALGYNIYKGSQTSPEQRQIQNSAAQLSQQGQQLAQYLQSGSLPPGIQQAVRQASAAARARAISNAAHSGMSTDPNQNSALGQELNAIDQQAIIQTAQIGQQLLTTGINEVGLANNLYMQLVNMNRQQGQSTGAAIGNFAAALAGSGRTQNKGTTNSLVSFG